MAAAHRRAEEGTDVMLDLLRLLLLASVAGAFAGLAAGSIAVAQTKSTVSAAAGAFDRLSIGNQKVARSLHQAQKAPSASAAAPALPVKPLTLDELAARHLGGQPWSGVFKDLKARGLVKEHSLGQVVKTYGHLGETGTNTDGTGNARGVGSTGSDGDAAHNGKGGR
jgi:hypothetical protein